MGEYRAPTPEELPRTSYAERLAAADARVDDLVAIRMKKQRREWEPEERDSH